MTIMIPTSWWSSLKVRMPVKLLLPSRTQSPGQAASVPGCRQWWRGRACSWGHTAAIRSCEHFGRGVLPSQSPLWDRFRPVGPQPRLHPGPGHSMWAKTVVAGSGEAGCTEEPVGWACTEEGTAVDVRTASSCCSGGAAA